MACRPLAYCVAILLCSTKLSAAATIALTPVRDNSLFQNTSPTGQLSSGLGDIFVGRANQNPPSISLRRGLILFDIAGGVPPGAVITNVTLTMTQVITRAEQPISALHRLTADWGEAGSFSLGNGTPAQQGDATWLYRFYNAANPTESQAWSSSGGDFSESASANILGTSGSLLSWSSDDNLFMFADIDDWRNSPSENFGWLLLGNESSPLTAMRLGARNSATPPTLLITIVDVPEPSTTILAFIAAVGMACLRSTRTAKAVLI